MCVCAALVALKEMPIAIKTDKPKSQHYELPNIMNSQPLSSSWCSEKISNTGKWYLQVATQFCNYSAFVMYLSYIYWEKHLVEVVVCNILDIQIR